MYSRGTCRGRNFFSTPAVSSLSTSSYLADNTALYRNCHTSNKRCKLRNAHKPPTHTVEVIGNAASYSSFWAPRSRFHQKISKPLTKNERMRLSALSMINHYNILKHALWPTCPCRRPIEPSIELQMVTTDANNQHGNVRYTTTAEVQSRDTNSGCLNR